MNAFNNIDIISLNVVFENLQVLEQSQLRKAV